MNTRSRQHAANAHACVSAVVPQPYASKYRALALSFPIMVLQSGLAQATGFLRAKSSGENEYQRYLTDLASILGKGSGENLHKTVIDSSLPDYQQLTRQALDASGWLKRYAQALLKEEQAEAPTPTSTEGAQS